MTFETLLQNQKPEVGETVAIMKTNRGDISIRFFPEYAPKAVENFITLAKNGYYDGITFHRVINNFMIQGGDPTATGGGGESCWGGEFEDEFCDCLFNFRGALSMANAGANTNGSQFFINQNTGYSDANWEYITENYDLEEEIIDLYKKMGGGAPWLDGHHTVFGQVYDGMDVVDAIAEVQVNANSKPLNDVVIESIEITTYQG